MHSVSIEEDIPRVKAMLRKHQYPEAIDFLHSQARSDSTGDIRYPILLAGIYQKTALSLYEASNTKQHYLASMKQIVIACAYLDSPVSIALCDNMSAISQAGLGNAERAYELLAKACNFPSLQHWEDFANCAPLFAISVFYKNKDVGLARAILKEVPLEYWGMPMYRAEILLLAITHFENASKAAIEMEQKVYDSPVWRITLCDALAEISGEKASKCYADVRAQLEEPLIVETRYLDWAMLLAEKYPNGEVPFRVQLQRAVVHEELLAADDW